MAKETITCTTWEEIGPALAAGLQPIIGFTCGLCKQRVSEEFHNRTLTTYHRVAEEECERLRAALVLTCGHLATVDTETNWLVKCEAIRRLAHEALGVEAITPEMLTAALAQS